MDKRNIRDRCVKLFVRQRIGRIRSRCVKPFVRQTEMG